MFDTSSNSIPVVGRISSGVVPNTLIRRTLEFVQNELPGWRDDPLRPREDSEEKLNSQLCKYLNVASGQRFPMVYFHHEEKQTLNRRVDLSALPRESQFIGTNFHSIYDPIAVFEGKRLPAPCGSSLRQQEYVTGGGNRSGGIQRFKLGLHGAKHRIAAIVGYLQEGDASHWINTINGWIVGLNSESAEERWTAEEQLSHVLNDLERGLSVCSSQHRRSGDVVSETIDLQHLWIKM